MRYFKFNLVSYYIYMLNRNFDPEEKQIILQIYKNMCLLKRKHLQFLKFSLVPDCALEGNIMFFLLFL